MRGEKRREHKNGEQLARQLRYRLPYANLAQDRPRVVLGSQPRKQGGLLEGPRDARYEVRCGQYHNLQKSHNTSAARREGGQSFAVTCSAHYHRVLRVAILSSADIDCVLYKQGAQGGFDV